MKHLYIFLLTIFFLINFSNKSFASNTREVYFAGGCFWCMEEPFEKLEGVEAVVSGFAGGTEEEPTYEDVASGKTGHREAVRITFDANIISYEKLLEVFWMQINPTDDGGQFVDRGFQYSTAIWYTTDTDKALAEKSKQDHIDKNTFNGTIVTPIIAFTTFHRAEGKHQDYYKTNKLKYKYYRSRSGRDKYLKSTWKK